MYRFGKLHFAQLFWFRLTVNELHTEIDENVVDSMRFMFGCNRFVNIPFKFEEGGKNQKPINQ